MRSTPLEIVFEFTRSFCLYDTDEKKMDIVSSLYQRQLVVIAERVWSYLNAGSLKNATLVNARFGHLSFLNYIGFSVMTFPVRTTTPFGTWYARQYTN